MPVLVESTETFIALPHKLWTREECVVLERTGVLDPERYELIEGELLLKMGKTHPHMVVQALLAGWLRTIFGSLFALQDPTIDLHPADNSTNEPQPDVIVLDRSIREMIGRPEPENVLLVAEVSDTSLSFDLKVKARLYARAEIAEYWVVDLKGRRVDCTPAAGGRAVSRRGWVLGGRDGGDACRAGDRHSGWGFILDVSSHCSPIWYAMDCAAARFASATGFAIH